MDENGNPIVTEEKTVIVDEKKDEVVTERIAPISPQELKKWQDDAKKYKSELERITEEKLKETNNYKELYENAQKEALLNYKAIKIRDFGIDVGFEDLISGSNKEEIDNTITKAKAIQDSLLAKLKEEQINISSSNNGIKDKNKDEKVGTGEWTKEKIAKLSIEDKTKFQKEINQAYIDGKVK